MIGKFISDIVLQGLSFVAENESESIRSRQTEEIKAAKERGAQFGRPKVMYSEKFLSAVNTYLPAQNNGDNEVEDNMYHQSEIYLQ